MPFASRAGSYERLGVTEYDTLRQPQITPQLAMIAKTIQRAGQPRVTRRVIGPAGGDGMTLVDDTQHETPYGAGADLAKSWPLYLHSVDDPEARAVLDVYYTIPKYCRSVLPIEAYCLAASVSPLRVLELIVCACLRQGAQACSIIAAINHPRVVEKTVEMALTDDGVADRMVLHRATGFLPSPAGAKTQINIQQNASASASAPVAIVAAPPPEQTVRRLVERFHEARGLPPPAATPAALTEGRDDAYPVAPTADLPIAAVISRSTGTGVRDDLVEEMAPEDEA